MPYRTQRDTMPAWVRVAKKCTGMVANFKLYPLPRWLVQVATAVLLLPLGALLFPTLEAHVLTLWPVVCSSIFYGGRQVL